MRSMMEEEEEEEEEREDELALEWGGDGDGEAGGETTSERVAVGMGPKMCWRFGGT